MSRSTRYYDLQQRIHELEVASSSGTESDGLSSNSSASCTDYYGDVSSEDEREPMNIRLQDLPGQGPVVPGATDADRRPAPLDVTISPFNRAVSPMISHIDMNSPVRSAQTPTMDTLVTAGTVGRILYVRTATSDYFGNQGAVYVFEWYEDSDRNALTQRHEFRLEVPAGSRLSADADALITQITIAMQEMSVWHGRGSTLAPDGAHPHRARNFNNSIRLMTQINPAFGVRARLAAGACWSFLRGSRGSFYLASQWNGARDRALAGIADLAAMDAIERGPRRLSEEGQQPLTDTRIGNDETPGVDTRTVEDMVAEQAAKLDALAVETGGATDDWGLLRPHPCGAEPSWGGVTSRGRVVDLELP